MRELDGEAFLVECNASETAMRRPSAAPPAEPVLGIRDGRSLAPWEASVSRVL